MGQRNVLGILRSTKADPPKAVTGLRSCDRALDELLPNMWAEN